MSQRLDTLVKQLINSDHGSEFIEKALSPSIDVHGIRVPDEFSEPTACLDTQRMVQLSPAFFGISSSVVVTGTRVQYAIMTVPTAGIHFIARMTYISAVTGGVPTIAHVNAYAYDTDPLLSQVVAVGTSSGVKYRTVASSITAHLDATALTNCGTVYASQVNNSYVPGIEPLTNATADKGFASYYWRGATFNETGLSDPSFLTTRAGSVSWDATDGLYAVQRNDGSFNWARADNCNLQAPTATGKAGLFSPNTYWEPCIDQNITVAIFDNIDPAALVVVKSIRCYEIVPETGSILQGLAMRSPTDMAAMALYKTMVGQVGTLYPADFNDWGTLWQGIKNLWAKIKTPVVAGLNFVPGVGGVLSKMASAIPTQTSKEKAKAEAKLKRTAEEDRLIRESQRREALKTVKNKGKPKPAPTPRNNKMSSAPTKPGKGRPAWANA